MTNILKQQTEAQGAYETIESESAHSAQNAQSATDAQTHVIDSTPLIPEDVYDNLPDFLRRACRLFTVKRERDIFLTGALVILSGCFNHVSGTYDGRRVYPNLFALVVAGAGRGKGTLIFAKMLAQSIHKDLSESSTTSNGNAQQRKLFYIPGNSSSAMVIKHLVDNGGFGTLCETEADVLTQTLKQDWGGHSHILRGSFQHEPISYSRKNNSEYIEMSEPKLSVLISGTPNQAKMLIPSPENGLFSRFIFYTFNDARVWKDVSPNGRPNLSDRFKELSGELLTMVKSVRDREITFQLTPNQWSSLNTEFENRLASVNESEEDDDAGASVLRLGLITYRIAMILTILRSIKSKDESDTIICSNTDFNNAMTLSGIYLTHAIHMFDTLPRSIAETTSTVNSSMARFYSILPNEFSMAESIQAGTTLRIKKRAVYKYVNALVESGQLQKVSRGQYKKG